MNRLPRPDAALDALNEERDHIAIQISLLNDSERPDPARLTALQQKMVELRRQISRYKPADA